MATWSSERLIRAKILLAGLGARRAAAVMLFVVSALAIAAAAIGPMFLQSADASVLDSTLRSTLPGQTDLSVISNGGSASLRQLIDGVSQVLQQSRGLLVGPIYSVNVGSQFESPAQEAFTADVLARTSLCRHLRFTDGACPRGFDQVAISTRSAAESDERLGSRIRLLEPQAGRKIVVTVVGIYRPPPTTNDAYWAGQNYSNFGQSSTGVIGLDPLVASLATVLALDSVARPQLVAIVPWSGRAWLAGSAAIASTAADARSLLFSRYGLSAQTPVDAVLSTAAHDEDLMSSVVLAIVLQLVVLTLLILYALGRATAIARRPEAVFARRHGFPRSALIALAVGEPALLILAALPVGVLAAWGLLAAFRSTLLQPGSPVTPDLAAIGVAAGTAVAGVLATAVASYQLWQRPGRSGDSLGRRFAPVLDAFAVALALAGLLSLLTRGSLDGSRADPLAALAPGLLTLGVGVIGLRIAAFVLGVLVVRSRESPRVAWFLALRQTRRRTTALRQVFPLAAATAVVLFSVGSYWLGSNNRTLVADVNVGAAKVVDVAVPAGVNLITSVRRADPSGRRAMAAAVYSSGTGVLLAVDSARLAAVAAWPGSLASIPVTRIARLLSPPAPAGVSFSGERIRLTTDVRAGTPSLALVLTVFDEVYDDTESVTLGPVTPGLHSYEGSLSGLCPATCRLLSISPSWADPNEDSARSVRFDLRGIAVENLRGAWRVVPLDAGRRGDWQASPSGLRVVAPRSPSPGVVVDIPGNLLSLGGLELTPVDLPPSVPAVMTTQGEQDNPPAPPNGLIQLIGLDGNTLAVSAASVVPTLPEIGSAGAMVDLGLAERAVTAQQVDTTFQVWLSPSAGPGILRRLRSLGISVTSSTSASVRLGQLNHDGLALAYGLALLISPIAAALAIGAVAFAIVVDGQRRRRELAALGAIGIPERVIRRTLFIENAIVMAVALCIGVGAGLGASALAFASLPEFASGTGGIPISTGVPFGPVLVAVAVLAALLLGIGALVSRLVASRSVASGYGSAGAR